MKELYLQFIAVNTKDYVNLGWDIDVNKILLILTPILILCCLFVNLIRKNMFHIVKQLTRHNATTEEAAKTLTALGLKDYRLIKWMLTRDGQLSRLVKRKGSPNYTYEEYRQLEREKKLIKDKIDFSTAEFYLNPDEELRIKKIIERYDIPVFKTVLVCVFTFVILVLIMLIMPEILTGLDWIVGFVKGIFGA